MEPIARSLFRRSICNWQPDARHATAFIPPIERYRRANRRVEFGAFKMHENRVAGSGRETVLRALEVFDHDEKIKLIVGAKSQICLELTDEGPKLFDAQGKEERGTVCIDSADIGPQTLKRIIRCALPKLDNAPTFKLGYFVAEKSAGTEWRVIAFSETAPSIIMNDAHRTFVFLTTEDFSGMMKRVERGEVVFCPLPEMIEKRKLEHVMDERLDGKFGIKSYFKLEGHEVEVSTVYNGRFYETMVFLGNESIEKYCNTYNTKEEAECGHWKLIDQLKASRTEDADRIARFIRFM